LPKKSKVGFFPPPVWGFPQMRILIFGNAIMAGYVFPLYLLVIPAMRLLIVTIAANTLEIAPLSPQRIGHSIEWNDVVNLCRWCIVAHFTHRPF